MISRWDDRAAGPEDDDLGQRVYSSRLLGSDPSLVLHGGGNTSVKSRCTNVFGDSEDVLFVKGSGWDLETIEAPGFAPCRIDHLLRLAELAQLSDTEMARELQKSLVDPRAPAPSVEAILHAVIPAKFVDHTHADAVLAITNSPDGERHARDIWGTDTVVVPYVMPGFKLARLCAEIFAAEADDRTIGMLLLHHGMFSFGATAHESYERMIELVDRAERFLASRGAVFDFNRREASAGETIERAQVAELRRLVSDAAGRPLIMTLDSSPPVLGFARRDDLATVSQQGPATPDHVIRTKRLPMIGNDVEGYASSYRDYFAEHGDASLRMLDPAPRVILDPTFGMATLGASARDAAIAADIYRHSIEIIGAADAIGGWRALPAKDVFDVEYWELEQAKLNKQSKALSFAGEVALVTGAASGIGRACVQSFLKRGAAVVGIDVDGAVGQLWSRSDYLGVSADLTDSAAMTAALDEAASRFGGLDSLVLNAGIFPPSAPIASLSDENWKRVMAINVDANLALLRSSFDLLRRAPRSGRVVVIGSKNVPAPGPGAAAYSASKAALTQLARVAALEWGEQSIRVNVIHPNAVFDTGIWTADVLEARAKAYGLSVDEYKRNNVLKVEVTSDDVAELAALLCDAPFAKTTGAQIPVDGGNERVI